MNLPSLFEVSIAILIAGLALLGFVAWVALLVTMALEAMRGH